MQRLIQSARLLSRMFLAVALSLAIVPVWASDAAALVRQIQKSFSPIQRHIVTQPHKAEAELAESRALFETLKETASDDRNIPRLEKKLGQLSERLAKRLGRTVTPRAQPSAPSPHPAPSTQSSTPQPIAAGSVSGTVRLPGSVTSRIRKIDKALDKTGKALDRGSVQRARLEYGKAEKLLKEIQGRYGDKVPSRHPDMLALAGRMTHMGERLNNAAGAAAAAANEEQQSRAANAALTREWNEKLSPYVTYDGDDELQQRIWDLKEDEAQQNRSRYEAATALLLEYEQVAFPLGKSMQLTNTENALRDRIRWLRAAYARQASEQASQVWITKLQPYVTSMGGKRLIASYTADVGQMQHQQALYREASTLFEEYLKTEFPRGKSDRLRGIEERLADELARFPEAYQRSVAGQVDNAGAKLDQEIAFLDSRQEWKTDTAKLPYVLADGRIADAQKLVDRAAGLLAAGDPRLVGLQEKMASLVVMNDERRKVSKERTRILPDRFTQDGADTIKRKANALVEARFPGIMILRTTVISVDWKEETVDEWTDTSRSAVRRRTTRSVTAQVAGRKVDGDVRLYTLHVAKDRRSDGTWSQLYGNLHSDLGDRILEENIVK